MAEIKLFNPVESFQTARSNALAIQGQEQALAQQPRRNQLADLQLEQAKQKVSRGTTEFNQEQAFQRAKITNQVQKALTQFPVEQRRSIIQTLQPQLEQFDIDLTQIPDEQLSDEGLSQGILKTQAFITDPQGSFGRLTEALTPGGERAFIQTSKSGDVRQVEGFKPPKSDATIKQETKQIELSEKKADRARQAQEQASIVTANISQAIGQASGLTTGFVGSISSAIPGTPAFDLNQTLEPIKANVGFNKLQQMRESSPTGGALGQVSDRENKLLQSVMGSFNQGQSKDQFLTNLRRVQVVFDAIINGPQSGGFSGFVFSKADFDKVPSGELYINGKTGDVVRKP